MVNKYNKFVILFISFFPNLIYSIPFFKELNLENNKFKERNLQNIKFKENLYGQWFELYHTSSIFDSFSDHENCLSPYINISNNFFIETCQNNDKNVYFTKNIEFFDENSFILENNNKKYNIFYHHEFNNNINYIGILTTNSFLFWNKLEVAIYGRKKTINRNIIDEIHTKLKSIENNDDTINKLSLIKQNQNYKFLEENYFLNTALNDFNLNKFKGKWYIVAEREDDDEYALNCECRFIEVDNLETVYTCAMFNKKNDLSFISSYGNILILDDIQNKKGKFFHEINQLNEFYQIIDYTIDSNGKYDNLLLYTRFVPNIDNLYIINDIDDELKFTDNIDTHYEYFHNIKKVKNNVQNSRIVSHSLFFLSRFKKMDRDIFERFHNIAIKYNLLDNFSYINNTEC